MLQQAVWRVGSKYCNPYHDRPCPEPTAISCPNLPSGEPFASCIAGLCEVRYSSAPDAGP
jgi:hypothetical protein